MALSSSPLSIYVPVAEFHRGNTATYVERALRSLGVKTRIIDEAQFQRLLLEQPEALFFCVDSGQPIDLTHPAIASCSLERVGYWFIDFRHHKHGPRTPTDIEVCEELSRRGGKIFQSQFEDYEFSKQSGWTNSYYLQLAAEPETWSDSPQEHRQFHLAFTGNVWDRGRAEVLQYLLNQPGLRFGFPGHGQLWMEDAAQLIRRSLLGFNVNSYYGTEYAYDVNMRFFETLSCGVPLITNWVPNLDRMFQEYPEFLRVYRNPRELPAVLSAALNDPHFLNSGPAARAWIEEGNTYVHRMKKVLEVFGE